MSKIQLPITKSEYFKKVLELLSPFYPFNKLTDREIEVLAFFLEKNYEKRNIEYDDRMKILFDYSYKVEMMNKFGISTFNLHNLFKRLRDKGFLFGETVVKKFLLDPNIQKEFTFIFNVSDSE